MFLQLFCLTWKEKVFDRTKFECFFFTGNFILLQDSSWLTTVQYRSHDVWMAKSPDAGPQWSTAFVGKLERLDAATTDWEQRRKKSQSTTVGHCIPGQEDWSIARSLPILKWLEASLWNLVSAAKVHASLKLSGRLIVSSLWWYCKNKSFLL